MTAGVPVDPMVEPVYRRVPRLRTTSISGRVLIFGSGALTHEQLLFRFASDAKITLYDPIRSTAEDILTGRHCRYFDRLETALSAGPFDVILCCFALHFEPQWIAQLELLWQHLKKGGEIYFAEDRGFRALLDGKARAMALPENKFNAEAAAAIAASFKVRTDEEAAPWHPDISASDYGLVFSLLDLVGERKLLRTYWLQREYDAAHEPACYLPWSRFANPTLRDSTVHSLGETLSSLHMVREGVAVTQIIKMRDLPRLGDLGAPVVQNAWRLVGQHALERLSLVRVPATAHHEHNTRHLFAHSFLHTAYVNLFRHFPCLCAAEIVLGFHTSVEIEGKATDLQFDPTLPACRFGIEKHRLSLEFAFPEFLRRYLDSRRRSGDPRYLAHELSERGVAGILLWPPPAKDWPEGKALEEYRPILPEFVDLRMGAETSAAKEIRSLCFEWEVPFCAYILGSFARAGTEGGQCKEKIVAAAVAYFSQNYRELPASAARAGYDYTPALFHAAFSLAVPLAGPSAYLEMTFKEHVLSAKLGRAEKESASKEIAKGMGGKPTVYERGRIHFSHSLNGYGNLRVDQSAVIQVNATEAEALSWLFRQHTDGSGYTLFRGADLCDHVNTKNTLQYRRLSDMLPLLWKHGVIKIRHRQRGIYVFVTGENGADPRPPMDT